MFKKLSEYIDDELDKSTCDEIEKHMEDCTPCKSCLETLRKTVALYREVKDQTLPNKFSIHLKDVIDQMISKGERRQ
jgi:anti-sigma factor RsiW